MNNFDALYKNTIFEYMQEKRLPNVYIIYYISKILGFFIQIIIN